MEQIPRNIFQTWVTKTLPTYMGINVDLLKKFNPEFKHHIFDDNDCYEFIRDNFDPDVLEAFVNLIPGAYKADLWRYCVLYIHGGIYLDIKFKCSHGFKLINLLKNESFCLDRDGFWKDKKSFGIYNAVMVCKPQNKFLLRCIEQIVKNVNSNYYGHNSLYPTGPGMLGDLYLKFYNNKELLRMKTMKNMDILFEGSVIMRHYNEYRFEQKQTPNYKHYGTLWNKKKIYKTPKIKVSSPISISNSEIDTEFFPLEFQFDPFENIKNIIDPFTDQKEKCQGSVPLFLWQTWKDKKFPKNMLDNINKLKKSNPEFNHFIFDDEDCKKFISNFFVKDVVDTFVNLIPGAYKADLWRYCVLYVHGGIYLDVKFECLNGFKLIELTNEEHYVKDLINEKFHKDDQNCIFNGIMINKPGNKILLKAIAEIVENYKNKYYGTNWLQPTGPGLLGRIYDDDPNKIDIFFDPNPPVMFKFIYKNAIILGQYENYRNDLSGVSYITYAKHWENRTVYLGDKINIPLKIWQTWNTKDLPFFMKENMETLKNQNPEFEHFLFDDEDCAEFIREHFGHQLHQVFLGLIPGAYKADLWRYCVLYIHGGIYLDIKYKSVGGFKLVELTNDEHYIMDRLDHFEKGKFGIHQSLLVCAKNNPLMLRCIKEIINNYQEKFYGYSPLHPTGPGLIGDLYLSCYTSKSKIDMLNINSLYIKYKDRIILTFYNEYREEQSKSKENYRSYDSLWRSGEIYV